MGKRYYKRLKRRCRDAWEGPAGTLLRSRYGVGGFDLFYEHARRDAKRGTDSGLRLVEEYAKAVENKTGCDVS